MSPTYEYTIPGPIPSKKNSKQISRNRYSGKPFIRSSDYYLDWHTLAGAQILSQKRPKKPIEKVGEVVIILYTKDARKGDLSNKMESVMDLLVDMGILLDDNWNVVPRITGVFGGIDKKNPRAEVGIFV